MAALPSAGDLRHRIDLLDLTEVADADVGVTRSFRIIARVSACVMLGAARYHLGVRIDDAASTRIVMRSAPRLFETIQRFDRYASWPAERRWFRLRGVRYTEKTKRFLEVVAEEELTTPPPGLWPDLAEHDNGDWTR